MERPVIGISTGPIVHTDPMFFGRVSDGINGNYAASVAAGGSIPVLLPTVESEELASAMIDRVDGLLLSGGHDIDPAIYGQQPRQALAEVCAPRDTCELLLLRAALAAGKPVLGICRGHQLLNCALGGTLYQDLGEISGSDIQHRQLGDPCRPSHEVFIDSQSVLYPLLGERYRVNSLHHQTVDQIAPGFFAAAVDADGNIEAIQRAEGSLVLGIQWHPEMMAAQDEKMLGVFKMFTACCQK
ncbi:gamma-glutamyl-gamma-aminobutyrate hydrolase family protein [Neobittarella massiliensis]|uniref:Gamma-glutamyl-gamma-aminobutyrate hydrolase family protein n=2 Tax=Oscillospiraceae TaxID=216572 RepID=A0A8J6LYA3_9FIRM|nr:gamma-glutamyl-gamma-aminobutyrate hydrolase family protein [Neobittarella massiliensis]MBC3515373.1 gamma-glutamyl-gamma-aminobutyrate hydrolase family protein [Neobittarella massiliensis]SCJ58874.1 Putative glutamine amidotransferase Rv2859c [uncultured Anaerotruncus sp.]